MSDLKPVNSRWRMLVLGLLWIFQLVIFSIYAILLGLSVGITTKRPDYVSPDQSLKNAITGDETPVKDAKIQIWIVVNIAMASLGVVLTCLEIVMHQHMDLTPPLFLSSAILKLLLTVVSVITLGVAVGQPWFKEEYNKYFVYAGIGFAILSLFATTANIVYAGLMYHRYRIRYRDLVDRYV